MSSTEPRTIAELRASGHQRETVKQEMRRNLLARVRERRPIFPGIVGYEETVIPQVSNAVISGHDLIFLGERGQAKSRLMRSMTELLDSEVPVMAGCEINDHPFAPICKRCRDEVEASGEEAA
ncbi:MAG TPA: magnesium chelatase, partial [Candidatus Limnocylindria bacterium]